MASYKVPKPSEKPIKIYQGVGLTPPKFMPSYYEWLSTIGIWIYRYVSSTGTIYQVPSDSTFFLVAASVSIINGTLLSREAVINADSGDTPMLPAGVFLANASMTNSNSYPIPLKFTSGSIISVGLTAGATGKFAIQGFLVKNTNL